MAIQELEARGYPPELVDAVAGHAEYLGVPRTTPLAKTLFAVDELSGFVAACARVRPEGLRGMTPKSVKKKLKQPSFAAGVDREQVRRAAEELGVDFDTHVAKGDRGDGGAGARARTRARARVAIVRGEQPPALNAAAHRAPTPAGAPLSRRRRTGVRFRGRRALEGGSVS